jgi:hypothetical protein
VSGNADVVSALDDAEINGAAAVDAVFEEQGRMLLSQLIVHGVVPARRVIGNIGRGPGVTMIAALALVDNHDLIVFE